MKNRIPRRQFLQTSSGAVAAWWVSGAAQTVLSKSPNEKVNVACIGCGVGGQGERDLNQAIKFANLVAICDIDDERLGPVAVNYPKAKSFNDYRKMLDEMAGQIDAVVVSTPDHHHAPAGLRAMRMGKHIYCQKPLTHTVSEARLMRQAARENNLMTQMGNQGTAEDGFRAGVELIQASAIGPIREVHAWTNRPFKYWKQAPDIVVRPTETPPVPEHVHWDLFLGPAPVRPYNPVYHPFSWRGWWDFGTGSLGDMACHTTNLAFMGLKLGLPERVSAESGEINPETYPAWATIVYEFPEREGLPPVKLTWYEGAKDGKLNLPSPDLLYGQQPPASGMVFIGEKGAILTPDDYGAEQMLLPKDQFTGFQRPPKTLPRLGPSSASDTHMKEWITAIHGGPKPMSNFDYAATMTEAMLLGNVAVRSGKAFDYDGQSGNVTNSPEAAALIDSVHRAGWEV